MSNAYRTNAKPPEESLTFKQKMKKHQLLTMGGIVIFVVAATYALLHIGRQVLIFTQFKPEEKIYWTNTPLLFAGFIGLFELITIVGFLGLFAWLAYLVVNGIFEAITKE